MEELRNSRALLRLTHIDIAQRKHFLGVELGRKHRARDDGDGCDHGIFHFADLFGRFRGRRGHGNAHPVRFELIVHPVGDVVEDELFARRIVRRRRTSFERRLFLCSERLFPDRLIQLPREQGAELVLKFALVRLFAAHGVDGADGERQKTGVVHHGDAGKIGVQGSRQLFVEGDVLLLFQLFDGFLHGERPDGQRMRGPQNDIEPVLVVADAGKRKHAVRHGKGDGSVRAEQRLHRKLQKCLLILFEIARPEGMKQFFPAEDAHGDVRT